MAPAPSYARISKCFHRPIKEASHVLNIGPTRLKHFCREHNIARWPYRQLCSMDAMIDVLEQGAPPFVLPSC